jgi:glycosyltransferase involved in cell wall biosynthesis
VHFHSVHIGPFVALGRALRCRGIPYVITPHGGFAPGRLTRVGTGVRAYVRLLEKPYLEGAQFVHAVSRNDVEGLRSLGVRARVVVPNEIDPAALPTRVDAGLLRRRFPGLWGKRVFLFLGRSGSHGDGRVRPWMRDTAESCTGSLEPHAAFLCLGAGGKTATGAL